MAHSPSFVCHGHAALQHRLCRHSIRMAKVASHNCFGRATWVGKVGPGLDRQNCRLGSRVLLGIEVEWRNDAR